MAKSEEKLKARELRRGGESIREIAKKLGVSKSSASWWCSDIELTQGQIEKLKQRDIIGGMVGRLKGWRKHVEDRQKRLLEFGQVGYTKVGDLDNRDLFLSGLALYWAEGCKKHRRVIFVNSDPGMIVLFIRWVKECFGTLNSQLTCRVQINVLHNARKLEIEQYWSDITKIPLAQFTKTTVIRSAHKKYYENAKDYYGVLTISVRKSTNLNYLILGGIDRLRKCGSVMVQ